MGKIPIGSRPKQQAAKVFPLRYGAGIFVVCVGLGSVLGTVAGTEYVCTGIVIGAIVGAFGIVAFIRRIVAIFGAPSRRSVLILYGSVASEMIVFGIVNVIDLCRTCTPTDTWLVILTIVALHFIPMAWSLGVWVFWLAIAEGIWLLMSLTGGFELHAILIADGAIKVIFGMVAVWPLLHSAQTLRK